MNDLENALEAIGPKAKKGTSKKQIPESDLILHQYAAVVMDSKILFGTVVEVKDDTAVVEVMIHSGLDHPNLFNYPPDDASIEVKKTDVLPLLPVFSLNVIYFARTNPVWELENLEAFSSFASTGVASM